MTSTTGVVAASLLSALLLWSSQPPVAFSGLAWVALVPVAVASLGASTLRSTRLAVPLAYAIYLELLLVPALPFGIAEDQWGDAPVPVLIGDSPLLAVALLAVPLFGLALYALRFPRPWPSRLEAAPGVAGALSWLALPAATWTALDFARTKLDPGGLWGPLFTSQHEGPFAPLAALAGPWLLTFCIVAVNYAIVLVLVRGRSAVAPASAVVGGLALLIALSPTGTPDGELRVAAVQPGYDTAEFEQPVLRNFRPGSYDLAALDMIGDLDPLTHVAARRGARLVVWPEAALWVDPRADPRVRRALALLARESRATIVVPYFLPGPDEGATVVVDPDGRFTGTQPKQRPMWFWGESDHNRRPPRPVTTDVGLVGTTLGVDNQDPRPARALAGEGAAVVTSSTHDWKQLAGTQRAFAQLHAVESGVPLVRADWRYGSAVYAAGGKRLADAGTDRARTVVVADVGRRPGFTPYVDLGDRVGWAALGLAALSGAWTVGGRASRARAAARRHRRRVPSSPA